jgi:hypothetical protein
MVGEVDDDAEAFRYRPHRPRHIGIEDAAQHELAVGSEGLRQRFLHEVLGVCAVAGQPQRARTQLPGMRHGHLRAPPRSGRQTTDGRSLPFQRRPGS